MKIYFPDMCSPVSLGVWDPSWVTEERRRHFILVITLKWSR